LLTADLVNARRRGRELHVVVLDAAARARATELGAWFLEIAKSHVGSSREDLEEAWAAVDVQPREGRLADGLRKLVEDRCEFDAEAPVEPEELRRELFLRASAARHNGSFDRASLVNTLAAERGLFTEAFERALYADLRGAHALKSVEPIGPTRLVDAYDLAQAQAVLLRAVRVTVDVECQTPGAYRALFHKLKFLRLLYTIQPRPEGGYRVEIDGPYSLFESVTKYGLQLALALPALRECDRFRLEADVRWGKERVPLTFRLDGEARGDADDAPPRLADGVARLVADLRAIETPWKVAPSTDILNLPDIGLCVPDLAFQHVETGECVYLEVLGFWSREAVWRRVELVERGLAQRILFAVSAHLRMSEAVLGDDLPGALYVYKRVMSAAPYSSASRRSSAGPSGQDRSYRSS
jgi:predicted nuclease of restriction endonuclease-like RecB superfamily